MAQPAREHFLKTTSRGYFSRLGSLAPARCKAPPETEISSELRTHILASSFEIDEPLVRIGSDELDLHFVPHVELVSVSNHHPFRRRVQGADEGSFGTRPRHDPVERLANSVVQQQRRDGLADGAFNLVLGVFALGAAGGDVPVSSSLV
jgi:hypothetical protein